MLVDLLSAAVTNRRAEDSSDVRPRQRAPSTDMTGASSDITGASSDITGAASDITGAASDITGASSDITAASSNITGALSNITGASSDITAASSDLLTSSGCIAPLCVSQGLAVYQGLCADCHSVLVKANCSTQRPVSTSDDGSLLVLNYWHVAEFCPD